MIVTLKGNYIGQTSYTKKDGTVVPQCVILSGEETVKVDNLQAGNRKKFEEVELDVKVTCGQYGMRVSAV